MSEALELFYVSTTIDEPKDYGNDSLKPVKELHQFRDVADEIKKEWYGGKFKGHIPENDDSLEGKVDFIKNYPYDLIEEYIFSKDKLGVFPDIYKKVSKLREEYRISKSDMKRFDKANRRYNEISEYLNNVKSELKNANDIVKEIDYLNIELDKVNEKI